MNIKKDKFLIIILILLIKPILIFSSYDNIVNSIPFESNIKNFLIIATGIVTTGLCLFKERKNLKELSLNFIKEPEVVTTLNKIKEENPIDRDNEKSILQKFYESNEYSHLQNNFLQKNENKDNRLYLIEVPRFLGRLTSIVTAYYIYDLIHDKLIFK